MTPEVLVSAIRERLDEIERVATAALGGMSVVGAGVWTVRREGYHAPAVMANDSAGVADRLGPQDAAHIALHDPSSVLRRVQADRELINIVMAWRHRVVEDCWYTCPAATEERDGGTCCNENVGTDECYCGATARQLAVLRNLAVGLGIDLPEDTGGDDG